MANYLKVGGYTEFRNVQDSTIPMLDALKETVYKNYIKKPIKMYIPVSEKTQIVNGIRYTVKIQITENDYILITFVRKENNILILESIV